jgi:hypothetical protein
MVALLQAVMQVSPQMQMSLLMQLELGSLTLLSFVRRQ